MRVALAKVIFFENLKLGDGDEMKRVTITILLQAVKQGRVGIASIEKRQQLTSDKAAKYGE